MKAEIELPQELVEQIADRVLQKILPVLEALCEPDQYMNVDDVSAMIGKSKEQIYQWVNRASHGLSNFPYQKAGRSLRLSKKAVKNWLNSTKNG